MKKLLSWLKRQAEEGVLVPILFFSVATIIIILFIIFAGVRFRPVI